MLAKLKQIVRPDLDQLCDPPTARFIAFLMLFTGLALIVLPEFVIFTTPDAQERRALVAVGFGALVVGAIFAVLSRRHPMTQAATTNEPRRIITSLEDARAWVKEQEERDAERWRIGPAHHALYIALTLFVALGAYLILFTQLRPDDTSQSLAITIPKAVYFLTFVLAFFVAARWESIRPTDTGPYSRTTVIAFLVAMAAFGLSLAAKLDLLPSLLR